MHLVPYQLTTTTWVASSRSIHTLKELPKTIAGKFAHLVKVQFDVTFTPTFAANAVPLESANKVFDVEFTDGNGITKFKGDFNTLRAMERMHNGRLRLPDPDEGATTAVRYWSRVLPMGPQQMAGSPSDFSIPTGQLENAQIVLSHRSLSDIDADLTALTASVRITCWMQLKSEITIPPAYQYVQEDASAKAHQMTGRCRYESIGIANSSSWDAISAGDFSAFRLDFGKGDVIPSVDAEALRIGFLDAYNVGEFGGVLGEPESATDDNNKGVNRSSPTAVAALTADLQPILWSPPGSKLNKLHEAESVAKLSWSPGSQTTGTVVYGRFLEQPNTVIATLAAKALKSAGLSAHKGAEVKTLSKKPVPPGSTMNLGYLPWKFKV